MSRVIPFPPHVPLEARLVETPPLPQLTRKRVQRVQVVLAGRLAPTRVRRRRMASAFGRDLSHAKVLPPLLTIEALIGRAVSIRQAVGTT